jgi:CheY-like chemotaxis protein
MVPTTREEPHVEHPNSPESTREYQVLIADNSESALFTTTEYFEEAGCNTISVRSREAAKIIIEYNAHSLDAVVLDRRLTRDDDAKDSSGRELACETRREFGELFAIVIYSRQDEGLQPGSHAPGGAGDSPDEIIYMSKEEHRGVLVDKVFQRIQDIALTYHKRPRLPIHLPPPVIILEGGGAASSLRAALLAHNVHARPLTSLDDLLTVALHLPSATFILDLDACEHTGGIEAVRSLKSLEDSTRRPFYVAVLASGEEFMSMVVEAGADGFIVKDSAETDALKLDTVMRLHKIETDQAALVKPVTELALLYYKKMVEQLREIKASQGHDMVEPLRTLRRALDLPSLTAQEQLMLTSLHTQMLALGARGADARTVDLCIEGAEMLADARASHADVSGWNERALRHSPDFAPTWVSERAFEELFSDDTEWDDE